MLDFKISELKAQIDPKDLQLADKNERIQVWEEGMRGRRRLCLLRRPLSVRVAQPQLLAGCHMPVAMVEPAAGAGGGEAGAGQGAAGHRAGGLGAPTAPGKQCAQLACCACCCSWFH